MLEAARPISDLELLSSHELQARLPEAWRRGTLAFIDWLLRTTPAMTDPSAIVEGICNGMTAIGIPVDRYRSSLTVNTADADAVGRMWVRGKGVSMTSYSGLGRSDPEYLNSPFYEAATTGRWVDLWLPETADDRFGVVPEFKQQGYTHYICASLPGLDTAQGFVTVATKAPEGFSDAARTALALIIPPLGALIATRITRVMLDRLLRTYVGEEPHRAILDGNVKRGQVSTIRSAILFADMRDSTGHTAEISAVDAVALFNDFFDCLVPPIDSRGGEVLKYIGDGLLAIFRSEVGLKRETANRALAAAEEAIGNVALYNQARPGRRAVDLGIALHFGEVAYGNIGSGVRLDFTVIGRDVGLANRVGDLNGTLGEPLLLSSPFAAKLEGRVEPVGTYPLRGFSTPMTVFRPIRGRAR